MIKTLSFGELESALEEFGYERRTKGNHIIFEHPDGRLMIVLPKMAPRTDVIPLHQKIVEMTIQGDSVINWDDFNYYLEHGKRKEDTIRKGDHLIWKVPGNGREIRVVAAAGEQDGLVVIKQGGAFSPCPVDQLRKDVAVRS
jgi:predicted RNA binding protein YcfA (HicA-like mRNA interferase family)